jgi:hypothetical protein
VDQRIRQQPDAPDFGYLRVFRAVGSERRWGIGAARKSVRCPARGIQFALMVEPGKRRSRLRLEQVSRRSKGARGTGSSVRSSQYIVVLFRTLLSIPLVSAGTIHFTLPGCLGGTRCKISIPGGLKLKVR